MAEIMVKKGHFIRFDFNRRFSSTGVFCTLDCFEYLAPVVQRLDNAIHRITHYPVDKCQQKKPRYPLDSNHPVDSVIQPGFEQVDLGVRCICSSLVQCSFFAVL